MNKMKKTIVELLSELYKELSPEGRKNLDKLMDIIYKELEDIKITVKNKQL